MNLKDKAARLVMSHISDRPGDGIAREYHRLKREVLELGIAGYVVFGGNVDSTAELIAEIAEESPVPLLVASDLERGLGQQLEGGTVFPTQMAVGATGVPDLAFAQGWATAREALATGIDLVLSPVADVASELSNPIIGIRSFGGDPAAVAEMAAAFVRGCQQAGAAATAKHFPGHGDTKRDSHIELPVVRADRALLDEREFPPFRAAIGAGVRAIMTAHVAYPALTGDDTPATLSPEIVDGILRRELGFGGVIVTDALLMGAISKRYGPGEAAAAALEAGADLLLMPTDIEDAINGVVDAVRSDRFSESRIDESLERLDDLHRWLGDYRAAQENHLELPPEIEGAFDDHLPHECNHRTEMHGDHVPAARSIARRGVTLVRDPASLLPLDAVSLQGKRVAAVALGDVDRPVNLVWFRCQLEAALPGVTVSVADDGATEDERRELAKRVSDAAVCVLAIFDDVAAWRGRAGPSDALIETARRAIDANPKTIVLAFTGPDIALRIPESASLVCAYDGSPPSQCAGLESLFGTIPMLGRLPVKLS